jgi:hypothetical protein
MRQILCKKKQKNYAKATGEEFPLSTSRQLCPEFVEAARVKQKGYKLGKNTMEKLTSLKTKAGLLLLVMGVTVAVSQAQIPDLSKTGAPNPGNLLKQFAGQLKPGAMLSSWASGAKAKWLSTVSSVKDAAGMAKGISSLTSFIKPESFLKGFDPASITQGAGAVKSLSDAGGLLKKLEDGLKPESFLSSWASKKPAFNSALDMLK